MNNSITLAMQGRVQLGANLNYSAEYKAILALFENQPSKEIAMADNKFLKTIIDGAVLSDLDILYMFQYRVEGVDALLNWADTTQNASIGAALNFIQNGGYVGNQSGYIKTGIVHGETTKLQQNDATIGAWLPFYGTLSPTIISGSFTTSAPVSRLALSTNGDSLANVYINDSSGTVIGIARDKGFMICRRDTSTQVKVDKNATQTIGTYNSVKLVPLQNYLFSQNLNNANNSPSDVVISMYFEGRNLTDTKINVLKNAYYQYLTDIGYKTYNSIIIFGDSIPGGQGTTVPSTKRFGKLLSSSESKWENTQSTGGATIQDVEIDAKKISLLKIGFNWWDRNSKVVLYAGTNDLTQFKMGNGSKSNFITMYGNLISTIKTWGYSASQIYICNLFWRSDLSTSDIEDWNTTFPTIATNNGVNLVDIYTGSKNQASYLSEDSIHPNDAGHVFIKNTISSAFNP